MSFIAGAFNATFNGKPMGTTEDGFELTFNRIHEEIRVDQYRGMVDGVFQGIDMTLRTVLMEADHEVITDILLAFDNDQDGTIFTGLAVPPATAWDGDIFRFQGTVPNSTGQLLSKMARPLVLTPCGGTTAKLLDLVGAGAQATALGSITFAKAVLTADPVSIKYAASLRKIPIAFHILPDWSSGALATGQPAASFGSVCGNQLNYFVRAA